MAQLTKSDERALREFTRGLDPLRDSAYVRLEDANDGFQVHAGQRIRVSGIKDTTILDGIFDTVQDNAEEFADELVEQFGAAGVVVVKDRVRGVELDDDGKEGYVVDLEVVAFFDPYTASTVESNPIAAIRAAVTIAVAAAVAVTAISGAVVAVSVARSVEDVSHGAGVLVPLAVIAIAAAVLVVKLKG